MDTATSGKGLKVAKHRPDSKDFPPLRQFNVTLLYRIFFWVLTADRNDVYTWHIF
jgi:hypothetical protein